LGRARRLVAVAALVVAVVFVGVLAGEHELGSCFAGGDADDVARGGVLRRDVEAELAAGDRDVALAFGAPAPPAGVARLAAGVVVAVAVIGLEVRQLDVDLTRGRGERLAGPVDDQALDGERRAGLGARRLGPDAEVILLGVDQRGRAGDGGAAA